MDTISEVRASQLIPELADLAHKMYAALMPQEIEIRISQGLRTYPDQQKIWDQGRNGNPGPIVTKAPPGYSMHNFGLAFDAVPDKVWGQPWTPDWDGADVHYAKMVAAGEALGLDCGADWHTFKDEPHFQLAGLPETPTDAMRADFANGGLAEVWSNVHAGKYKTEAP